MTNKMKSILQPIVFIWKFKGFLVILLSLSCTVYLLDLQIHLLNLELKNLTPLIQSLEETQVELKKQLLFKDQQITLLETHIDDLKSTLSTLSYLNETQNFELLKDEVLKANTNEITQFYFDIAVLVSGCILTFLLGSFIKELLIDEILELNFVDATNNIMWLVKIPNNKKAEIVLKNINPEDHAQVLEFVKTIVLKSPETLFTTTSDNVIGLITPSVPMTERIIAASHITEIIGSLF